MHQQLFSQQLLHQKILEEQFAVAASAAASRAGGRDFLLMSEADREKQLGIIFQQVSFYHFYIGYNIERSIPYSFEYNVRIVFFFSPKNCEY